MERLGTNRQVTIRRGPGGVLGGLRIAGRIESGRGVVHRGPRHYAYAGYEGSYGLVYVTAGDGRYRDPAHDVHLRAGSLISLFPGRPHWYGVVERDKTWNEVFLIFEGPLFRLAEARGLLDSGHPVQRLLPVPYWQHRIDEFRVRRPPLAAAARDAEACDLLRMITEINSSDGGVASRDESGGDWFRRSRELLESAFDQRLPLPEVAAEAGMVYETWRRRFRSRAGCSPGHYRLLCRVDAARELLTHTALPTREIAAALGFADVHHLIRHFRTVTGMTPRQYRDAGDATA